MPIRCSRKTKATQNRPREASGRALHLLRAWTRRPHGFWSLGRCCCHGSAMAKMSPSQPMLLEPSMATVLRTTNCLQSLKDWAPLPVRRRRDIRRRTQSRPQETTDDTLRYSPEEAGATSIVGFEVVAAVDVMERSNLSCTCISVAQWRHQRKYTDVPNHRSHSKRLTRSKRTRTGSHSYTVAVASEINYRCARVC